jgi:hypothetical protein
MANYPSFDTNYPGEVYELEIVRNEDYANL